MPAYVEQPVPTAFEDVNGHLNVRHYTGIASEGLDESLVEPGIPQNWPARGHACFSAEHHLTYLAELRTGDRMSARVRLLGRSERAAHALVYLLDDSHQRLSFVMEEIFLHIDMETRRTAPWPDDVAAALDERIAGTPSCRGSRTCRGRCACAELTIWTRRQQRLSIYPDGLGVGLIDNGAATRWGRGTTPLLDSRLSRGQ